MHGNELLAGLKQRADNELKWNLNDYVYQILRMREYTHTSWW